MTAAHQDGGRICNRKPASGCSITATLAEIEPLASLRRQLRRLAAQHDELAEGLESARSIDQDSPRSALG
jgi:hypothetical protein